MGFQAVQSHAKGKTHKRRVESFRNTDDSQCLSRFIRSPSSTFSSTDEASDPQPSLPQGVFHMSEKVRHAEILWTFKAVESNYSFSSCNGSVSVMQTMFPDSHIVKNMTLGETKSMYLAVFGIAP